MAKMNYMVVEGKGKDGRLIRKEGPLDLRLLRAWSDEVADQCEPDSVRVLFALTPVTVKRQMVTVVDVPDDLGVDTAAPKAKRKRRSRAEMAALRASGDVPPPAAPRPVAAPVAAPGAPVWAPGSPIPEGYFDAGGFIMRKPVPGTPENLQALAKQFGVAADEIELDRGQRVNFTKAGRPRMKRGKRRAEGAASTAGGTLTYETQPGV